MSKLFSLNRAILPVILALLIWSSATSAKATTVSGTKHLVVLRVYFNDYSATSRYAQTDVEGFFTKLAQLWGNESSYGNISITSQVSSLYKLPSNRSTYIDTPPDSGGDLSSGGKYMQVLKDAVSNAPSDIDWTTVDGVVVIMAETDTSKSHRGQGNKCNLTLGPTAKNTSFVGCAIFSENPGNTDVEVWGRWAHEVGHALQDGGPPHLSDYNSNFEQMDGNYPGQTGVFEKQTSIAFGWLPDSKYAIVTPPMGGGSYGLYAEEYNPATNPDAQAIKAYIGGVGSAYYLVSARRRTLGDDLNDNFSPNGIPDEGVLIERVTENTDPWVILQGKGGDRDKLWHPGDSYTNSSDGITITVRAPVTSPRFRPLDSGFGPDTYIVDIINGDNSNRPDVGLNSWLQAPGNTYESTDIWVDSPVNGYGTYRFGMWSELLGGTVPKGNGDDPAIGQVNRIYARIRNFGTKTATNVVVHFDVTNPLGLGINGSNGFTQLGTVTSANFPGLASISAGGSTDVYIDWTPNATLTPDQLAQGIFFFHSCVRIRVDHLSNEIIFGNQDGSGQQENIDYFQAPAQGGSSPGSPYKTTITMRNDDVVHPKSFMISYEPQSVPPGWIVVINNGQLSVDLAPNETRAIPVQIEPVTPMPLGSSAAVVIQASSLRLLTNNKNPNDKHPDFQTLGGVRVEGHAVATTHLTCSATPVPNGVSLTGKLTVDYPGQIDPKIPVYLTGQAPAGINPNLFASQARVSAEGSFTGTILRTGFTKAACLYAGTDTLASATSGYITVPAAH